MLIFGMQGNNFFLGTGTVMIYLEKIVFVLGGWVSTSDLLPQIEPQNQWCGSGFVDPDLYRYNKSRIRIRMERYESRTLTVDVQKHVKADIQISFLIYNFF